MATAADHKATYRRAIRAFNNPGNRSAYFEMYHPAVRFRSLPGVFAGLDAAQQFFEAFWLAFPDTETEIGNLIAEDDRVACTFVVRGTHRDTLFGFEATGRAIFVPGLALLRFEDGKCVEEWAQVDFLGAMQQLGLAPPLAEAGG